jgi:hypothetical protein
MPVALRTSAIGSNPPSLRLSVLRRLSQALIELDRRKQTYHIRIVNAAKCGNSRLEDEEEGNILVFTGQGCSQLCIGRIRDGCCAVHALPPLLQSSLRGCRVASLIGKFRKINAVPISSAEGLVFAYSLNSPISSQSTAQHFAQPPCATAFCSLRNTDFTPRKDQCDQHFRAKNK